MSTNTDKRLLQTAFHESGHIVFTYLTGYSIDSCELLNTGDGKTTSNYGNDLLLIAAITNCKSDPDIFNNLDSTKKRQSPFVADRIVTILLAGSIAESAYLNGGIIQGDMSVEVSGPDLIRVENAHHFLSEIKKGDHDSNYIQKTMRDLFGMMNLSEIWTPISKLAKALADKKYLNKNEIEEVLNPTGYLDYIKTL